VFKLGMTLGYPRSDMVFEVGRAKIKCIFHTNRPIRNVYDDPKAFKLDMPWDKVT